MKNKAKKQLVKYLLVGGSTAAFELILYAFLRKIVCLDIAVSNITAVIVATTFNFIINRSWSFKVTSNMFRSMILYTILFFMNMFFSTNAIIFMSGLKILDVYAKFITMCMITMWNFVLYRNVIFK